MSSIAAGVNAERTNRWLLIGALVLAVLAGVLVFALLANFGDDDGDSAREAGGPTEVLVANQTINPGTNVTSDMFDVVGFESVVPNAVTSFEQIDGLTTKVTILESNQASLQQFVVADNNVEALTYKVPDGMRAYAMSVSEDTAVGGLIQPSDRVDIVVRYSTKPNPDARVKQLHLELFAENVEVLAVAQTDVEGVAQVDSSTNADQGEGTIAEGDDRRPEDLDPDPGANTVTLALTQEQVLRLGQFEILEDGKVSIALRRFGDDAAGATQPLIIDVLDQ